MLASPGDEYMLLVIPMMIAFVLVALGFVLIAEFVRRRSKAKTNPPAGREPGRRC